MNSFGKRNDLLFASIIYAKYKEEYLLHVIWSNENLATKTDRISRFKLDECERISYVDLERRLLAINTEKAQQFLTDIAHAK